MKRLWFTVGNKFFFDDWTYCCKHWGAGKYSDFTISESGKFLFKHEGYSTYEEAFATEKQDVDAIVENVRRCINEDLEAAFNLQEED